MENMIAVQHSAHDIQHRRLHLNHTHGVVVDKCVVTSGRDLWVLEKVKQGFKNAEIVELKSLHGLLR